MGPKMLQQMISTSSTAITMSNPRQTGPDEHEQERPYAPQRTEHAQDCAAAIAGRKRAGQPGADEATDAGHGECEPVLPGAEAELAKHEHGERRFASHDQPVNRHRVEEQSAQLPVVQDVAPALGQPGQAQLGGCDGGGWFSVADRDDAHRGEQVTDGVGGDGHDRAEQPDRGPAEGRADDASRPGGGLEPGVSRQQVGWLDEGLQERAAGGGERSAPAASPAADIAATSAVSACSTLIAMNENALNPSHVP